MISSFRALGARPVNSSVSATCSARSDCNVARYDNRGGYSYGARYNGYGQDAYRGDSRYDQNNAYRDSGYRQDGYRDDYGRNDGRYDQGESYGDYGRR